MKILLSFSITSYLQIYRHSERVYFQNTVKITFVFVTKYGKQNSGNHETTLINKAKKS